MVSQYVDFQLIWDTASIDGYVPGNQIVIYWEENGGVKLYRKTWRKSSGTANVKVQQSGKMD